MTDIVLVQASRILTDAQVVSVLPSLQKWDDDYLRPAWSLDAARYGFATMADFQAGKTTGAWPIFINNHSRDPGALGFHSQTPDGQPFGRVFVGDCLRYGISWTVDLSHEAGEMREDPTIDNFFTMADGRIVMREVGDAVEADENGIMVDGLLMTDFVMPNYFSTQMPPGSGVQFDYQRKLHGPCPALTPGGYMGVFEGGQWTQVTAMFYGGAPTNRSLRHHNSHRTPRAIPTSAP
jgi:hypothetical protein